MSVTLPDPAPAAPIAPACGVVELRQYTLHPGRRDALIELFERGVDGRCRVEAIAPPWRLRPSQALRLEPTDRSAIHA